MEKRRVIHFGLTQGSFMVLRITFLLLDVNAAEVRLVGGGDKIPNAGQVELWHAYSSQWATVCDADWHFRDVQATCQELGFPGAAFVKHNSYFNVAERNLTVGAFDCNKGESNLSSCSYRDEFSATPCKSGAAGVVCTAPGYVGCYSEGGSGYVLSGSRRKFKDDLSVERCLGYCRNRWYHYAGVESGTHCRCGNMSALHHPRSTDSRCKTPCSGNTNQTCGEGNPVRISLYEVNLGLCDDPGTPLHGERDVQQATDLLPFYFGTIVKFTCAAGFRFDRDAASTVIQCSLGSSASDGAAWNGSVPSCSADTTPTDVIPTVDEASVSLSTRQQIMNSDLSQGGGAGIAVAVIFAILVLAAVVLFLLRRKRKQKRTDQPQRVMSIRSRLPNGMVLANNPTYSNMDIIPATKPPVYAKPLRKGSRRENTSPASSNPDDAAHVEGSSTAAEEGAIARPPTSTGTEGAAVYENYPSFGGESSRSETASRRDEECNDAQTEWVENIIYE
ncbi:uncharacterized protein LOC110980665 isoform X2 [Acanthaster planci]|uniref:Uncharacterized protein LOC110980665 isoform X2 n=1 Tax=Acanthaster planci TaxID=133434 RepID=A0A8B7YP86_ACAPL|nr:uncharacterized protein LOC110980665 isoform X2 [Acanthaster planci]